MGGSRCGGRKCGVWGCGHPHLSPPLSPHFQEESVLNKRPLEKQAVAASQRHGLKGIDSKLHDVRAG